MLHAPSRENRLESLTTPLLADDATAEVLLAGDSPASEPRGDVVLFLDRDVLATRGLVSGHAHAHLTEQRLLVLGYTPLRVLHERVAPEFAARLRAPEYEARCDSYERDPAGILTDLWGGNFSLRREHWLALGMTAVVAAKPRAGLEVGARCLGAGLAGAFDRSLRALRLYEPSLSEFVRDAREEAAELELFGRQPGDLRGAVPRLPGGAVTSLALRSLVLSAGSLQVWRVQDLAARLLWALEGHRSARDAGLTL